MSKWARIQKVFQEWEKKTPNKYATLIIRDAIKATVQGILFL